MRTQLLASWAQAALPHAERRGERERSMLALVRTARPAGKAARQRQMQPLTEVVLVREVAAVDAPLPVERAIATAPLG